MLCVHVYVTQHMGENDIYRAECKYYALRRSMVEFKTEMEKKPNRTDFSSQHFIQGTFWNLTLILPLNIRTKDCKRNTR